MSLGSAGAGIGGMAPNSKVWALHDLDHESTIYGQFIAQDVSKDVSGSIAESSSVNRQSPILQWVGGELEVVTFRARIWANNKDESIEDNVLALEDLVKRNTDLKRPPVCTLSIGTITTLDMDCLVASIGGVVYDEPRDDGSLRGVQLSITLKKYEEIDFTVTDPSVPESFTRKRRAKKGDTYESIAADEYGNAMLGVLVRQLNPRLPSMDLADLNPRDPVHIYPEEYLLTLPLEPQFHAFKSGYGNEAAEARWRDIFKLRGGTAYATAFADTSTEDY